MDWSNIPERVFLESMPHSQVAEPPVISRLSFPMHRLGRLLSSIRFWWAISLLWAGVQAWSSRQSINPDGMSYLDMASETLKSGPHNLVNGHWSPLYPALISLMFFIFHPSPGLEFPVIHLLNFLLFAAVLGCFTFFITSWLAPQDWSVKDKEETDYAIPFCFGIFLWFTMEFITVSEVSPDLCMAGIVFLGAGSCCRISFAGSNRRSFAVFGVVLGLGYYTKSPLFVLGLALLALLFIWPPSRSFNRARVLLAGLTFLIVTAPLVALISKQVGHPSIGETGRLNYEWQVNGMPLYTGWTGSTDDVHGVPEHPPRILFDRPRTLEFTEPVKGTYPLWYDPTYWYAGAKIRFNLREQLAVLKTTLGAYYQLCIRTPGLFAGVLMLCISIRNRKIRRAPDGNSRWLVPWVLGALSMYAVVHVEPRYVAAYFVLFWLAVYNFLWQRVTAGARIAVLLTVLLTLFVPSSITLVAETTQALRERARRPDYVVVGEALRAAGVHREDRLATVGYSLDAFYARYAGAQIVAQIIDPSEFWLSSESDFEAVKKGLTNLGVKAIVSRNAPAVSGHAGGWREVVTPSGDRYSILTLKTDSSGR